MAWSLSMLRNASSAPFFYLTLISVPTVQQMLTEIFWHQIILDKSVVHNELNPHRFHLRLLWKNRLEDFVQVFKIVFSELR